LDKTHLQLWQHRFVGWRASAGKSAWQLGLLVMLIHNCAWFQKAMNVPTNRFIVLAETHYGKIQRKLGPK
jgi:hypothetical protein